MSDIFNKIYKKYRKEEIIKSNIRLKKITINSIMKNITNTCWNYDIYYEIIIKTFNRLIIRVKVKNDEKLIQYDKKSIIFIKDFNEFLIHMNMLKIENGVYISTGVFDESIIKLANKSYLQIELVDGYNFIKEQLGISRKAENIVKGDKLSFIKYLPE